MGAPNVKHVCALGTKMKVLFNARGLNIFSCDEEYHSLTVCVSWTKWGTKNGTVGWRAGTNVVS